ncbi:glucosamine-6-phosphate deaminase [Pollutibacter soli]|uniref:glucosamine-6-phosphate deaminase n=1 Tax=Pollutibacter soli TaxID=3034157 RepID=UPI003013AB92
MQLSIHATYEEMSQKAAEAVIRLAETLTEPLICFPSGNTPVLFLQNIVNHFKEKNETPNWYFISLDEWLGVPATEKGSCRQFLDEHFFQPLSIPENRIFFFDGLSPDPEAECRKAEQWLDIRGNIKICVLGLGQNGHLGLNEPGSDFGLKMQIVSLTESTIVGGRKYFSNPVELNSGITLGLATIMNAGTVFLLVNGSKKAAILQHVLEGTVTPQIPATILKEHPDCWVYMDEEAIQQQNHVY